MKTTTKLLLLGALIGLFAAYAARAVRLIAAATGMPEAGGVVLVEGLSADLLGLSPAGLTGLPGLAHIAFGALVGAVLLRNPRRLAAACLAGLGVELLMLAFLTPVKELPNTNLEPLGAVAIAVFWMLLGFGAAFLLRRRPHAPGEPGAPSLTVHRTALAV